MANFVRRAMSSVVKRVASAAPVQRFAPCSPPKVQPAPDEAATARKELQILLQLKYRELKASKAPLPSFDDVQLRAFSQNGEDGILLYIFSLLGTTNRRCVEICAGDGIECNTANLIVHHGWDGLLVDGNERKVQTGREFYRKCKGLGFWQPKFAHTWITAESVNDLVRQHGFCGDVDLLSLDIDGNDYWIWEAIDCIQPRVVVLEYQISWGAELSASRRYNPNYVWNPARDPLGGLTGASLPAFVKLGRVKGYHLVGAHRCNAFFVKDGIGEDVLPECPVERCFHCRVAQMANQRRINYEIKHGPLIGTDWVEV